MSKFKVGDIVVVKVQQEAYYSDYAGNPKVMLTVGMVGMVGAIDCPPVHGDKANFDCVDFIIPGVFGGRNPDKNPPVWRGSFRNNEIRLAKEPEKLQFQDLDEHLRPYPWCDLQSRIAKYIYGLHEYNCEFCGFYRAEKPKCNKCEEEK